VHIAPCVWVCHQTCLSLRAAPESGHSLEPDVTGLCRSEWEKLGQVVAGPDAEDTMAVGGKSLYGRTWVSSSNESLCVQIRHL
jgi:hypothetical protein